MVEWTAILVPLIPTLGAIVGAGSVAMWQVSKLGKSVDTLTQAVHKLIVSAEVGEERHAVNQRFDVNTESRLRTLEHRIDEHIAVAEELIDQFKDHLRSTE